MFTLTRRSPMDKAKGTLRDVASYADEVIRDEKLRADILAAIGHGAEAGDRLREDINAGGIASRLASDRKLRRKLRATLDDLDNASDRLRRRRRHYVRNIALIVAGAGAVAAIVPKARRSFAQGRSTPPSEAMQLT